MNKGDLVKCTAWGFHPRGKYTIAVRCPGIYFKCLGIDSYKGFNKFYNIECVTCTQIIKVTLDDVDKVSDMEKALYG